MNQPLFPLGQTVATRGAVDTISRLAIDPLTLLSRHVSGDWGDIDPEDPGENKRALKIGDTRSSACTAPKRTSGSGSLRRPIARRPRSSGRRTTEPHRPPMRWAAR